MTVGVAVVLLHPNRDVVEMLDVKRLTLIGWEFSEIRAAYREFEKGRMTETMTLIPRYETDPTKVPVWDINPITSYSGKGAQTRYGQPFRTDKQTTPMYPERIAPGITTEA
jgi:hypothetical protein